MVVRFGPGGLVEVKLEDMGGAEERSPKISERIARRLVNYIIDNDLPRGTRLPNERELVESFGVGRTTLREALRLLETRGAITIKPGPRGGPVVRRPLPEDLSESLTLILQFEGASLNDIHEAREAMEPMMARLAADRITDTQLAALDETIELMRENLGNHDLFLRENQRFHAIVAEATGSTVLRTFNDTLKAIADGASVGVIYGERQHAAVAKAHELVAEALRKHDSIAAEEAMLKHIGEAGSYWRRHYPDLVKGDVRGVR
jgi:GntR family transcriptional repressor for pyruvate dehydrogenase complex